jgi:hypothetical protein
MTASGRRVIHLLTSPGDFSGVDLITENCPEITGRDTAEGSMTAAIFKV